VIALCIKCLSSKKTVEDIKRFICYKRRSWSPVNQITDGGQNWPDYVTMKRITCNKANSKQSFWEHKHDPLENSKTSSSSYKSVGFICDITIAPTTCPQPVRRIFVKPLCRKLYGTINFSQRHSVIRVKLSLKCSETHIYIYVYIYTHIHTHTHTHTYQYWFYKRIILVILIKNRAPRKQATLAQKGRSRRRIEKTA
jgi:hypothetical protein